MITFTILLIALLALAIITTIALLVGGTGVLVVFGDVIVFVLIVWTIVRLIRRRR